MSYFSPEEEISYSTLKERSLYERRHRLPLPHFSRKQAELHRPNRALSFQAGDVLTVTITKELEGHGFTGICLGIRKASLSSMDTSVILRNVLFGVGVEILFSLFENRAYRIRFEDHLRKGFFYAKSKLFYLRRKVDHRRTRR